MNIKNISIQRWYGRLGNNIIQVKNGLTIAYHYNCNLIIPSHRLFTKRYIVINSSINEKDKPHLINSESEQFFYQNKIKIQGERVDVSLFTKYHDKVIETMKRIFRITSQQSLKEDDLVIHIRSGDIFNNKRPHRSYVPPPLWYYQKIIESYPFQRIYLIAEDRVNPCINALLERYQNIQWKRRTLEEDIQIIMNARHIVMSIGTFIPQLTSLSTNCHRMYRPMYNPQEQSTNTNKDIPTINLSKYHAQMYPWKNTQEQRKRMMNYHGNEMDIHI